MEYEISMLLMNPRDVPRTVSPPDVFKLGIKKISWNEFSLIWKTKVILNPSTAFNKEIFNAAELNSILCDLMSTLYISYTFGGKPVQFTDITTNRIIYLDSLYASAFIMDYILNVDDELLEIKTHLPGERYYIFIPRGREYVNLRHDEDYFKNYGHGYSIMHKYNSIKIIKSGGKYKVSGDTQVIINNQISDLDILLINIYANYKRSGVGTNQSILILDEDNRKFTVIEDKYKNFYANIMNYFVSRL